MNAPPRRRWLATAAGFAAASTPFGRVAAQDEYGDAALRGAGSTFVQPLMEAWVRQYRDDPHDVLRFGGRPESGFSGSVSGDGLDYEPVGSLAGIQRIRAGFVDFAASEMPLGDDALRRGGLLQFPWVVGAVAIVAAPPDGGGPLQLDVATLAGLMMGRITRWSDPAVAALNPDRRLPDQPVTVVHRSDGSGTTYTVARYLADRDPQWQAKLGADLLLKWPVGVGAKGGDGMVRALQATRHAIGYVNAVQARRAGLPMVALRNAAGRFVLPEAAGVAAALAGRQPGRGGVLPIDAPGDASYPLVATVFGLMRNPIGSARQRRTAAFVRWSLAQGAPLADRLGYVSLPAPLAKATIAQLLPDT
ncbi:MAG: phosphate ABC transporter substrate-binding protein PstS [Lautropia sp.]